VATLGDKCRALVRAGRSEDAVAAFWSAVGDNVSDADARPLAALFADRADGMVADLECITAMPAGLNGWPAVTTPVLLPPVRRQTSTADGDRHTAAGFPVLDTVTLAGQGHHPDDPEPVAAALRDFLPSTDRLDTEPTALLLQRLATQTKRCRIPLLVLPAPFDPLGQLIQRYWLIGRAWRGRRCGSRVGDPADSQLSRAELLNRGTDSLVRCGGSLVKAEQRGLVLGCGVGDQGIVGGATEDLPGGQRGEKLLVAGL
jgi:hypothetical protein